jgi:hypothetical protein
MNRQLLRQLSQMKQHILSKSQTTLNQFIKLQSNQELKTFRERLLEFIV